MTQPESILRHRGARNWLISALLIVFLTGCSSENLYTSLGEQEANEMLALLLSGQIDAKKQAGEDGWTLVTSRKELPRAMQLLNSHGYPKEQYQNLGQVFAKEGFVSSPTEERARWVHGLSQELSRTVSAIDGVLVARVHLAIPREKTLSKTREPASASVFIKHRVNSPVVGKTSDIKALVVNSVRGLSYENVSVLLFEAVASDPWSLASGFGQ